MVPRELDGERLDRAIAAVFPGVSRGEARRLLAAGRVRLGRETCRVAGRLAHAGTAIALLVQEVVWTAAVPRVVHETADFAVLDKPAGVAVQAGREAELPHLLRWWKTREPRGTPFVVHRLDVPASGLVVLARNRRAAAELSDAFARHAVERAYRARTSRALPIAEHVALTLELPLARRDGNMVADPRGEFARSRIRIVARDPHGDELEVELDTGRHHQIRAHLAALGSPIAGDTRYGSPAAARMHLHASRLAFSLGGERFAFASEAPWDVGGGGALSRQRATRAGSAASS